jgi:O-Glycosyl hydrolase family 30
MKKYNLIILILTSMKLFSQDLTITLLPETEYQTIHHFGASDAWTIQKVGLSDNASSMADMLFSTDMDDEGNPLGIGLSLWRFNLGAGSLGDEQLWKLRSTESFLKEDGSYDWSAQEGQRRFIKLASERGVDQFVLFSNSPPVNYTNNGKAYGNGRGKTNLHKDYQDDFSRYIVDTVLHFAENENIRFTRISPVNEPQWNWSDKNGQEGSPYRNNEIASLIRILNNELLVSADELDKNDLDIQIEIPEAAKITFLSSAKGINRGRQVQAFFDRKSRNYLGNLDYIAHEAAGHSYFTSGSVKTLIKEREKLANTLKAYPFLEYWMTEFCIINGDKELDGKTDIGGMKPALFTARIIHHDLSIANASSWQWWLGMGVDYSYNDGLLYWLEGQSPDFGDSKTLWALGNYSRFIRPGAVRISLERDDELNLEDQAETVMGSAYRNIEDGNLVIVLVNYENKERVLQVSEIHGVSGWNIYVTDDNHNLENTGTVIRGQSCIVPPLSVVTLQSYTEK